MNQRDRAGEEKQTKPVYEQTGFAMTCRGPEEYAAMFALDEPFPVGQTVLDVGAGASSYTAEARKSGVNAFAVDPLYRMLPDEMDAYGRSEMELAAGKIGKLSAHMDWSFYGTPEGQLDIRRRSLDCFLMDYRERRDGGEPIYTEGSVPHLPFPDEVFDLVLCSHFLFLYDEQLPYAFHLSAVRELLRVVKKGGEARVYPLFNLRYEPSVYVNRLLSELADDEADASFLPSRLPFIPGSHNLLVLQKK